MKNIKLLKLNSSEDIIAIVTEIAGGFVTVKTPIKLFYTIDEEDSEGVSFLKWIPFTGDEEIKVNLDTVVTMVNITEEMHNFYDGIIAELQDQKPKEISDPLKIFN